VKRLFGRGPFAKSRSRSVEALQHLHGDAHTASSRLWGAMYAASCIWTSKITYLPEPVRKGVRATLQP
jgi:hypothetical protein